MGLLEVQREADTEHGDGKGLQKGNEDLGEMDRSKR